MVHLPTTTRATHPDYNQDGHLYTLGMLTLGSLFGFWVRRTLIPTKHRGKSTHRDERTWQCMSAMSQYLGD